MGGPPAALAAARRAVREQLRGVAPDSLVLVACSGGPDSLALAAALGFEAPRLGLRAGALVVDHALQPGSDEVAAAAAAVCQSLNLDPVDVLTVHVAAGPAGPEASAREARYAALEQAAERLNAEVVLLGHTRDDQAEQVLLGLARGSGARSLAGMPVRRGRFIRPLLALGREDTQAACAASGLRPWHDPHNDDRSFTRVRARHALAALEADLGPGLPEGLARSAALLREDADLLDALAHEARQRLGTGPVDAGGTTGPGSTPVSDLAALPAALRRRVLRLLAIEAGARPGSLTARHLHQVDALVCDWRGQGLVDLPGRVAAARHGAVLRLVRSL